mmetsp:Transcript_24706/g.42263  ORF Transcript_24706/g.42263 Transcript_24706/m.42263 type:complete len:82 (-) Transcript_24706:73-318(-)
MGPLQLAVFCPAKAMPTKRKYWKNFMFACLQIIRRQRERIQRSDENSYERERRVRYHGGWRQPTPNNNNHVHDVFGEIERD